MKYGRIRAIELWEKPYALRCLSSFSTASLLVSRKELLPSGGLETFGTRRSSTGGGTAGGDCWEFLRCLFTTHIN